MLLPLVNMQAPPEKSSMPPQQMVTKVSISILVMALPVLYVSVLHVPPATLIRDTTFWFLMSNSIIVVIAADSGMLFFGPSSSSAAYVDDRPFLAPVASTAVPVEELLPVVIMNDRQDASDVVVHVDTEVAVDSHAHALVVIGDHGDVEPERREMAPVEDGVMVKARLTESRSMAREERAARRRRSRSHSHALVAAVPDDDPVVQDKSVVVVREEKLRRTATEGRRRPTASAEEEEESEFYARLSDEELNRRVEDFITRFNREIRLQVEKETQA
uniref:Uncharacterized protein n=1 Tax=Avena sativa TaxID=4498 RepID=A0ACD6A1T3_AVESA